MSLLKDRSFHAAPMGLRQKMAFWSGFTYYISTALFVFVMPLPTIVMLWFFPEAVQPSNYVQPGLPGIDPAPDADKATGFARFALVS